MTIMQYLFQKYWYFRKVVHYKVATHDLYFNTEVYNFLTFIASFHYFSLKCQFMKLWYKKCIFNFHKNISSQNFFILTLFKKLVEHIVSLL